MLLLVAPLILGIAFLLAGLWLTWRRLREADSGPAMCCGACGFPAGQLTSFRCGGCQADVRVRGLTPARSRGPSKLHPLVRLAVFSLLLSVVAAVAVNGPWFSGPECEVRRNQWRFTTPDDLPGLRVVDARVDLLISQQIPLRGNGSMSLITDTGLATLYVRVPGLSATVVGHSGPVASPAPLTRQTFNDLARAAGLDPADELVAEQMDNLCGLIEPALAKGQPGGFSTGGRSGRWLLFNSISGGGGGGPTDALRTIQPARWTFAGFAAIWLAGVARLLPSRAPASASIPASVGVGDPGGGT